MGLESESLFGNSLGRGATVAADTVINRLVPPRAGMLTRVGKVVVTAAGTAHALTALRKIGRTTASAAFASGQAVINLTADPGTLTLNGVANANGIAANDYVAVRESDGITRLYKVSSVSTLAITMTGNFTTGGAAGADVWFFGVAADTDPNTGSAHPAFTVPASATTTLTGQNGGLTASTGYDEPILVQDNNATAAGVIEQIEYAYTKN